MEIVNEKSGMSIRSWARKTERKEAHEVDYYPELRTWIQHAIIEAEKINNHRKKNKLLGLLKDL